MILLYGLEKVVEAKVVEAKLSFTASLLLLCVEDSIFEKRQEHCRRTKFPLTSAGPGQEVGSS